MIKIIKDNKEELQSAYEKYLDTATSSFTDFENSLIIFMYAFLKLFQDMKADGESKGVSALKLYFNADTKVDKFFKFTQIIRVLSKFSPISRFIATELLIHSVKRRKFDYFVEMSIFTLIFKPLALSDRLSKLFVETALRFPFQNILLKFCPSNITEKEFKSIIIQSISNIKLVEMPATVTGLTLSNNMICLRKHSNSNPFSDSAMFYVILHELAHLLQRTNASNFRESLENRS